MHSKLTMLIAAVCVTTLWADWGIGEKITTSDLYNNNTPYVVVGTNNYKHLVWASRDHANEQRYYKRWYPKTGWTSTMTIKSPAKYCFGSYALALDGNGTDIHVAWQAYDPSDGIPRVYYAKCVPGNKGTGGWGRTICLSPDRKTWSVDVACLNNRVAVAWSLDYAHVPPEPDLAVGLKECVGGTWQTTQYIDIGCRSYGVSIAADPQARYGDLFYMYQSGGNAYVMRRVGSAFQTPELAAEGVSQPTVEVDPSTGYPHIVCRCGDNVESHIYHTYRDASGIWQPLTMVSDAATLKSIAPRMCFSGGSAWVVWDEYVGSQHGVAYAVGEYNNWTRGLVAWGWAPDGFDDATPDITPVPGGNLYCVWSDGRSTPDEIWGSLYAPGDGGEAEPTALAESGIEISPNPVRAGRVTVHYALPNAGPMNVSLLDVSGRTVRTQAVVAAGQTGTFALDASGLKPGVYILKLHAGLEHLTRKLVIQ